jgi:nucleolar pre-ribosomal-associated protein 1
MQLITSKEVESVEWIKILDNVMTAANSAKIEVSSNGGWRNELCRCLLILLHPNRAGALIFCCEQNKA